MVLCFYIVVVVNAIPIMGNIVLKNSVLLAVLWLHFMDTVKFTVETKRRSLIEASDIIIGLLTLRAVASFFYPAQSCFF